MSCVLLRRRLPVCAGPRSDEALVKPGGGDQRQGDRQEPVVDPEQQDAGRQKKEARDRRHLAAVLSDGIDAVEAACQEALDENVCSSAVIINILARRRDPAPPSPSSHRTLFAWGRAAGDCARYDSLRRAS